MHYLHYDIHHYLKHRDNQNLYQKGVLFQLRYTPQFKTEREKKTGIIIPSDSENCQLFL